jgi:shikimate dehydrogenase
MSLRFVLFGHPVAHSVSPAIHVAAYRELGLPHRYELVDAPDRAAFARGVAAVRSGEIAGANVTVPYKLAAFELADRRAPSAGRVGAANVLQRASDGAVVAHNTDVPALAREIEKTHAAPPAVLVLGNGGAALAAVAAAELLGAREIAVSARRWQATEPSASWARAEEFARLGATLLPWPGPLDSSTAELRDYCRRAKVVIQATTAGMHGAEPGETVSRIVPWKELSADALAYDLVYNPPETEFLRMAQTHGLTTSHGLGMLVGQAALAFELWLGVLPPEAPLRAAAEGALRARRP